MPGAHIHQNTLGDGLVPLINKLQDIFNELPELNSNRVLVDSCSEETNDHFLGIYVGSLIRSILALHNLVNNKIKNKKFYLEEEKEIEEAKKKALKEEEEKKKKAEKEKKDKESEGAEKAGAGGAAAKK